MFLMDKDFSDIARIKHAFFTRKGGISDGVYASLNTGLGSADNSEHVRHNQESAMQALGYCRDDLYLLSQVHSDIVVEVTGGTVFAPQQADALVTKEKGKVIGVQTADCGPVLFADSEAGVIGAAHAGWKGAIGGVLDNTVMSMEALGADRSRISAVLGPCIRQSSYEVDAGFKDNFLAEDSDNEIFFIPSMKDGHVMFDLAGYIVRRLHALGLWSVSDIDRDTCAEEAEFFSYRRTCLQGQTKEYGRLLSTIVLL